MAQINYRFSFSHYSWRIPTKFLPRYKISFGVWCRKTTDHPLSIVGDAKNSKQFSGYEPLPQGYIRLLSLAPGHPEDDIHGYLKTVSLDELKENGGFEALSYVWGDYRTTSTIYLDDSSFQVTENLLSALRNIRSTSRAIVIWIDAICINQSDIRERSIQVSIMRDIYATADRVIVWLGPSTEHTVVGIEVLQHFARGGTVDQRSPWRSLPPLIVQHGLEDIIRRAWFYRVWVVQEAAVARDIVLLCGDYSITWSNACQSVLTFMRSLKLAVASPSWQQAGLGAVDTEVLNAVLVMQLETGPEKRIWSQRRRQPDLLEYAYNMRHRQSTDARDKVYALLGFASMTIAEDLGPDYTKPAEEVYDDFVRVVTNETRQMCAELASLKEEDQKLGIDRSRENASSLLSAVSSEQVMSLERFIELTCNRATENISTGDLRGAANLMESAAMLLRSETFGPFR